MYETNDNGHFRIIWPESKWVSPEKINSWYLDAVANRSLDGDDLDMVNPYDRAKVLHEAGIITLIRKGTLHKHGAD